MEYSHKEKKKIFILVGPSGSGKDTLGAYLKEKGIPELVSHTTRGMRKGEVNGISYHFISKQEFSGIEKIEYSEYAGNFYCLSKKEVEEKLNKYDKVFAITNIDGMEQVKKQYPNEVVPIFIDATLKEMKDRMKKRGDSEEEIRKRIDNAIKNKEFLNKGKCKYVIRNKEIKKAKEDLYKILSLEKVL